MLKPGLLANRNFLLLWGGQTVSILGSVISRIAIMLWIAETTGSATVMTTMLSLAALPSIVLGLFAGSICDRFSRRTIIVWGDGLKAVLCLGTTLFFFCHPAHSPALLTAIYVLYIGTEVVNNFFYPALRTIMPDLIPLASLPAATAIEQTTIETVSILGQGAGGLLLKAMGLPFLLLLDGISFLISAWAGFLVRAPAMTPRPSVNERGLACQLLADTLVGIGYIWQDKGMRTMMMVFWGTTFFLEPIFALLPFFVRDQRFLGAGGEWYGFLMGGVGVGGLIGHWLNVVCARSRFTNMTISFSLLGIGISCVVLGLLHSAWIALVVMTLDGVFVGMLNNQTWTIMQGYFPSHLRGRTDAAWSTFILCAAPLALWLSGIVADASGQRLDLIFVICGLMTAAIGLWAQSRPAFREFLAGARPAEPLPIAENIT